MLGVGFGEWNVGVLGAGSGVAEVGRDLNFEEGMAYPDLLRLAMKREEGSLRLYNDLQMKAEEEEVVKVFKMLSQEEAKHKLALETLYDDYMAGQGD